VLGGPAVRDELDELHALRERFWQAVDRSAGPYPSVEQRMAFALGLAEIATNIIRYAYPADRPPGELQVILRLYSDRLEALLQDHGQPFVETEQPVDSAELPEHGFGLALARRSLDQVEYERDAGGVNHWRLVKRL
jgi:anti-sigma regulatory factor (Ser/Thr protein kinase)